MKINHSILRTASTVATACLGAIVTTSGLSAPNSVDYGLYFDANVRDSSGCAMTVTNGRIVIDPKVTNPAVSCPDMFS